MKGQLQYREEVKEMEDQIAEAVEDSTQLLQVWNVASESA
jgi:hypothetical protein